MTAALLLAVCAIFAWPTFAFLAQVTGELSPLLYALAFCAVLAAVILAVRYPWRGK